MGAIAILLGLGICIFLFWFFESVMKDSLSDETREWDCREVHLDKGNADYNIIIYNNMTANKYK